MTRAAHTDDLRSTNRVDRRKGWRSFLHSVEDGLSLAHTRIAGAFGVSKTYVTQALGARSKDSDPMQGAALALDDVPALLELGPDGERFYDAIVDRLAALRGRVVREEHAPADDLGNDLENMAALTSATGLVCARLMAALADLRIDRGEAGALRPIVREAIRLLHRWDVVLEQVEREGVVAVRGVVS